MQTIRQSVSAKTTYILSRKLIQGKIHVLTVTYEHEGKLANTPIVMYRFANKEVADNYTHRINEMIVNNGANLCMSKLSHWKWKRKLHPIVFTLRHRN